MGYLQRLTVSGANAYAVPDYRRERARALGAAFDATEYGIDTFARPADGRYGGLGDVDGDTSWLDVANTFVGSIGTGVANLIGGKPQTTVINQAPAPKPFPWVPVVAVAGGAAVLLMLMKKRKGRR